MRVVDVGVRRRCAARGRARNGCGRASSGCVVVVRQASIGVGLRRWRAVGRRAGVCRLARAHGGRLNVDGSSSTALSASSGLLRTTSASVGQVSGLASLSSVASVMFIVCLWAVASSSVNAVGLSSYGACRASVRRRRRRVTGVVEALRCCASSSVGVVVVVVSVVGCVGVGGRVVRASMRCRCWLRLLRCRRLPPSHRCACRDSVVGARRRRRRGASYGVARVDVR